MTLIRHLDFDLRHFNIMSHSILIIDNDAYLAGIYARRFEQGHWKVQVADSVKEAERQLSKSIPDTILIDIETVPNAFKFLKSVKTNPKSAKLLLIALTKPGERSALDKALKAGADDYLLKGHFVPREVKDKLERLVALDKSQ